MKLNKDQIEQLIEIITDYMEYDVETCGYQDYDITGYVETKYAKKVRDSINKMLSQQGGLAKMFELQRTFQKLAGYKTNTNDFVRFSFMGIITEACEALEETNWKPWKQPRQVDMHKFKGEIVDIWHFLINLTIASGMDANELLEQFIKKNEINTKRQKEKY